MPKTPDEIKKGLECCADGNIVCAGNCVFDDDIKLGYPDCVKLLMTNALALIQQLEAQVPRWISVEERLPERDKEVLCFFVYPDSTTVCQNVYYGNGHWLGEGSFVTHWMPLPEPPKEEE